MLDTDSFALAPRWHPSFITLRRSLFQAISSSNASPRLAPYFSAADLLNNSFLQLGRLSPVAGIPMIIHQSWKDHSPPAIYNDLILSWRRTYPDAVYVLWNDAENQMLVDQRYPELKEVYKGFEKEIYKADFIRNLYMCVLPTADHSGRLTDPEMFLGTHSEVSTGECRSLGFSLLLRR